MVLGACWEAARRFGAAPDCMVVNVVVMDRKEGAGEEKVLPSPPPSPPWELTAPPTVAAVPALEYAASE